MSPKIFNTNENMYGLSDKKEISQMTIGRSILFFTYHYLQMGIAMGIGCAIACMYFFDVLQLDVEILFNGIFFGLWVTIIMTIPMALWMRYGMRHSWQRTNEMSGLMFLPLIVLIPFWLNFFSGDWLCTIICVLMYVIMLGIMLYRWDEYSHPHTMQHSQESYEHALH